MHPFNLNKITPLHYIAYSKVNYNLKEELFSKLLRNEVDLKELKSIKNETRKVEWMTIRSLLIDVMHKKEDVVYDVHRKPFFKNSNSHLSISHSKDMIAISINKTNITGIDIQYISEKIIRIKDKFLNEKEQLKTSKSALELSYYWSIKEALFKVYGKKDAFLREHIEVTEIEEKFGKAKGVIKCNNHYSEHDLELKRVGNYVLAYTLNY